MGYPLIQSVGVVVFRGSQVLLVSHGTLSHNFAGVRGLPAGKIDPGETAVESAVRELREETGLVATHTDLVPLPAKYQATITQKDGTKIFDWYVFLCRRYSGVLTGTAETEPFWVEMEDLEGMELLPNVYEAIQSARNLL